MRYIRIGKFLAISIVTVSFLCVVYAQTEAETAKKTIKLSNGEEVIDLSGEWDEHLEYQGMFSGLRSSTDKIKITQEGNSFVGVKLHDTQWWPKGSECVKGELQKDGFKTIYINRADMGWTPCKWKISENGNTFVIDDERVVKATFKRK